MNIPVFYRTLSFVMRNPGTGFGLQRVMLTDFNQGVNHKVESVEIIIKKNQFVAAAFLLIRF